MIVKNIVTVATTGKNFSNKVLNYVKKRNFDTYLCTMNTNNALLSVENASIAFGKRQIFKDLTFHIHQNAKIALVGKNGTGKSTLMKIIMGVLELDEGERWQTAGLTIGYLEQEAKFKPDQTIFDYVFEGVKSDDKDMQSYKVEMVVQPLELDVTKKMSHLSGGQLRRASLAKALVEDPDILLLDEPTNHLDLHIIEWLENYLIGFPGTVLCISHDKRFLETITNKIFWLDRGNLRVAPKGFSYFEEWSEMLIEQEERELRNRQKALEQELEWANRGVKARRKRNVRRLELVRAEKEKLKADKSSFNRMMAKVEVQPIESTLNSKVAAEFFKVSKSYDDLTILDQFSLRIMKGDRIGILGKNGSGKSTFLKMLVGEEEADQGKIKRALNMEFSYFDQKRKALNPDHSIQRVLCSEGGDYIDVRGKSRHVCGYMKDFMFDPVQVRDPVKILSGGQQNRLLLAKVLAEPKDFLILDEPTNDLDMDTLEMLEEILSQYKGTLIIVSHDRDFLDQTVTKILGFEGDGVVKGCIGGYSDYLEMLSKEKKEEKLKDKGIVSDEVSSSKTTKNKKASPKATKLSYKLQYELDHLPEKMDVLSREIEEIEIFLAREDAYSSDPEKFNKLSLSLGDKKKLLDSYETRWLELENLKSA